MPREKASEQTWFDEDAKQTPTPRPAAEPPTPLPADNRRRHARFHVSSTQVLLFRDGFLTALMLGGSNKARKVCDLSQGGARIMVTEKLTVKQKVRLKITLEKYQDQIEIGGEVKWCHPCTNKKDFYVGIKFQSDDPSVLRKMTALHEWFTSPQYRALRSRQ